MPLSMLEPNRRPQTRDYESTATTAALRVAPLPDCRCEIMDDEDDDDRNRGRTRAAKTVAAAAAAKLPDGENSDSSSSKSTIKSNLVFYFLLTMLAIFVWTTLFALAGDAALPGGHIFALFVVCIVCWIGGELVDSIHLPPLLGMLVVGFCLRNVPHIDIAKDINPHWSRALRNAALAVILSRAGLGMDSRRIKRLSYTCAKLAVGPCLQEGFFVVLLSRLIFGFAWSWAFILGFVIAGVSPAVVVPSMLRLQAKGYGVARGIPTLLMAAGSLDNVVAISATGIAVGINFSTKSLAMTMLQGPLEVLIGVGYGSILGLLVLFFEKNLKEMSMALRAIYILLGSASAIFAGRRFGFPGSGPLGCLVFAFVASSSWQQCTDRAEVAVCRVFNALWIVFQPILFGLIGSEIILDSLQSKTIVLGLVIVAGAAIFRFSCTYWTMIGSEFSRRESLFIGVAWLPKATVQAAIGSVALDTARQLGAGSIAEDLGRQVLTIAVLAILITAPAGAMAIDLLAPRLLTRDQDDSGDDDDGDNDKSKNVDG